MPLPNAGRVHYELEFGQGGSMVLVMVIETDLQLNPNATGYDLKAIDALWKAAGKHATQNAQHVARFVLRSARNVPV